uniref:Rad21/Rec8-like protein N-terminal domain-containing protein n=1 Tax=Tetraodon nigroviridis TaxID=99883 RepID=H3CRK6_TETNG
MFYYPVVLKRHTGCFSTIWLVATKAIRIPRRDFLKVDVKNTCNHIMNYVLEQFSLYLSSQLQYGLVLVFHRQCVILLEDLQSIVSQLVKQKTSKKIDMEDPGRQVLDIPDALLLLEETEGALDPLFGVLQDVWLSPGFFAKVAGRETRDREPGSHRLCPASPPDLTASPDTITLRDVQPVSIPLHRAQFEGEELVDQHRDTLDFLLAQTDHFPEGDLELLRQEREVEKPTAGSSVDAGLMPLEDTGLSAPPAEQRTPVSIPMPPPPPSEAKRRETPAPQVQEEGGIPATSIRPQDRPPQLIFFDPVTQVPPEDIQRQIDDPQFETRSLPLPPSSPRRRRSAAELLNNPCTSAASRHPSARLYFQGCDGNNLFKNKPVKEREPSSESADSERERQRGGQRSEREVSREI